MSSPIGACSTASTGTGLFHGDRGPAFHRWRFHNSPHDAYDVVYLYRGETLMGYVATRSATYEGFHCLFLIDALFDRELAAAAHVHALLYCLDRAYRAGCDILFTLINPLPAPGRALSRFPLLRVPGRLLPQEVPLFFIDLAMAEKASVDPRHFAVTPADLDVF